MEIISSLATKVLEHTIDAIIHQFGYLVYYKNNMKGLKEQAENLVSARSRMQHLIDEAKDKAEDVEDDVYIWLTKVDEITEETYRFLINIGEEKDKSCLDGTCFNLVHRHRLSRKAKKMRNELAMIKEQGNFDKVSYCGPLPGIEFVLDYVTFASRRSIAEEIMKALRDPNINMIGVHGMGGIGKTVLVKEISYQVKTLKLFEPVIMMTVGENSDVKHIQGLLGDMLNLRFFQETEQGRAALLKKRLSNEKKILIIFDDIWKDLDFERIGIPSINDNKECKILVTSRARHVLSEMSIEENFEVKDLTEEESWNFFKNMVDESIETNRELKKLAIEVANKCGKLPIALVIIAKALKGKPLHAWRDALRQLKNPASVNIKGVSNKVYVSLKLSYDNLNCREAQLLFLLCGMFPDDYDIDINDLSRYAMGLKFLQDVNTFGTTRDKILTIVDDLVSSSLLQKSKTENDKSYVKMHDVIRDVAIYIGSKVDQMCTLSYGKGLNEWQDEKTHGYYTAIFANCENFQDIPEKFSFPHLELLALVKNTYLRGDYLSIPEGCLEGMEKLKVLHLEGMRFSLPTTCFNYLVNLRVLLLSKCCLGNIDMIGELINLEILDFSKSDIVELPLGMGQLSRLKQLNVSYCRQLEVIPAGVISRLTKLEELYIDNGFDGWEVEELEYCEKKNVNLLELNYLPCLTSLHLCVPNVEILPENTFLNNLELENFRLVIGKHQRKGVVSNSTSKKLLDIRTYSSNVLLNEGLNKLLNKSDVLILEDATGVKNVILELCTSVSPHLRHLNLMNNEDIEYLASELDQKVLGFSILESLRLCTMTRMETIIQGYSMKNVNVFGKLETLEVSFCDKMKYLLPFFIMKGLSNLKKINVRFCEMMEVIVVMENEQQVEAFTDKIELRQLKSLFADSLPNLNSFCGKLNPREIIQSQSSEIIEEEKDDDDQLLANYSITPSDVQISFPNLESLWLGGNIKNIWYDLLIPNNLSKLKKLDLNLRENLKSVFTGEALKNIEELQTLHICNCNLLEDVFRIPKLEKNELDEFFAFSSKLDRLALKNLPNLKKVWNKDPDGILISFQCLTNVKLEYRPNLERLFPAYLCKQLQQLQHLSISQCGIDEIFEPEFENSQVSFPDLQSLNIVEVDNLEIIWHKQLIVDDMSNLKIVTLNHCKSLKGIFTSNVMRVLKKLEELCIQNCDSVVEVFEIHQTTKPEEEKNREVATINLKKLKLRNLRSLKRVWSNDPFGMCHFQNLNYVEVIGCPKLKTLFPPSVARDLPHYLQHLHIDDSMDVIFVNQETSKKETSGEEFKFKKDAFIKLAEIELDGKKVINSNFSKEYFPALKVLKLNDLGDYEVAPIFSLEFHQLLYGLERLDVHKASLVEIFSYDKAFTHDETNRSRRYSGSLKKLFLTELPKLLHIWKESSCAVRQLFDNLEVVRVKNCSRLETLVMSSSFSFRNLKQLTIYKCHGLRNLLDPSVARTLVRLKEMKLFGCKSMTTVLVGSEDEIEEEEIVFTKLEALELYNLPKLRMFQLAKYTIKFPYLKILAIEQCPEMKMFSPGLVCTPLLKSIDIAKSEYNYWSRKPKPKTFWAGDINATIRQLWEDDYDDSIHNLFKEENLELN